MKLCRWKSFHIFNFFRPTTCFCTFSPFKFTLFFTQWLNRQSSESRGLHLVRAFGHGPVYIGPCLWVLCRLGTLLLGVQWACGEDDGCPKTKGRKGIRNADQALTVHGEHADRIVGSPSWSSSINYNRSMPEDLKASQISSSLLPPPFRGLHSPGVRKHCQIIFRLLFLEIIY